MKIEQVLKLIVPLLLIPITLYAVQLFGHLAGNIIIGIAFLVGILKFTENQYEKRFVIVLSIFAILFETANVALGMYKYINVIQVPVWVGLGWGILGIYLLRNLKTLKEIDQKYAYALAFLLHASIWVAYGAQINYVIPAVFGIAAVYVLAQSSKLPASFFALTSLMGAIIEFSGTTVGVWTYFDDFGKIVPPPLSYLAMAYASVVVFSIWIVKLE